MTNRSRDAALLAILQDVFDAADDGSERILSLSRNNLHRGFSVILKRAGIIQWPDLFQTLRRSCEIEWATHFPQHAVSRWLGHSMQVSERHYLSVTDDLFEVAAAFNPLRAAESAAAGHGTGSHSVAVVQDASKPGNAKLAPCHGLRQDASPSEVGRGGIEPPTPGFSIGVSSAPESQLTGHHHTSYANTSDGPITEAQQEAQHYGRDPVEITPDLAQVIEAWPTLPPAIREAVLATLRAAE